MNSIVILAQAGSGFGDFVRQIPIGPIAAICGFGAVLVVVMVFIVRARVERQKAESKPPSQPAYVKAAAPRPAARSANPSDLPDLDLLVDDMPAPAPAPPRPAPVASTPAAPTRAAKTGVFSVNVSDGSSAQAVEVVTILRDVVDGGLIIQMGDKTYRDLGRDETFRSSFLKIMRELSPVVTQAPPPAEPQPASVPVDEPPAPETDDSETMPDVRDLLEDEAPPAAPQPPPPLAGGQMPGDLPKFTLEEEPQTIKTKGGLLGRTKTEFVPVPELDIAGAIEAYLQHKLQHTPDFAGRSIHVHPSEDGGVAIEVDGQHYEAVGDVADDGVRSFLTATIQEWQQRHNS